MLKGETKTGFVFEIDEDLLNDYEILEIIADIDDNPLLTPKLVDKIFGKDEIERLKDHVRTAKGTVPIKALMDEITYIFNASNELKN